MPHDVWHWVLLVCLHSKITLAPCLTLCQCAMPHAWPSPKWNNNLLQEQSSPEPWILDIMRVLVSYVTLGQLFTMMILNYSHCNTRLFTMLNFELVSAVTTLLNSCEVLEYTLALFCSGNLPTRDLFNKNVSLCDLISFDFIRKHWPDWLSVCFMFGF